MNRRHFLSSSAATLAAAPLATSGLHAQNRPATPTSPPTSRIPIGFLGASHSHALPKIKIALASPDWELIGVHEPNPTLATACQKLGVPILPRPAILAKASVVAIESDVKDHARDTLDALRVGRHVHVEKPPADTLTALEEMIAIARAQKLQFQTGYMWRYNPAFTTVFHAVRQGWLGQVFMVRASMSNSVSRDQRADWGQFRGGSLFELGSHMIDALVRLLGKPRKITSHLRNDSGLPDAFNDNNCAVFEFDQCMAILANSSLHPGKLPPRSFEVIGSKGAASIRPVEPPSLELELAASAGPYRAGLQTVPLPSYTRYEADLAELAAAVRGERPLTASLDDELAVQEVLLRACSML